MLNTFFVRGIKIFFAGVMLSGLHACESRPDPAATVVPSTEVVSEAKAGSDTDSPAKNGELAHEKKLHSKPGAAVSLKNSQPLYAAAPGIYEYELQLLSSSQSGKMAVVASIDDGVTIISPKQEFEFVLQEGGEYLLPLTLNISAEGRHYIQLHVSIAAGEQISTRVIAAILQVGEPAVKKAQKTSPETSAEGEEAVISLPAQETISPR